MCLFSLPTVRENRGMPMCESEISQDSPWSLRKIVCSLECFVTHYLPVGHDFFWWEVKVRWFSPVISRVLLSQTWFLAMKGTTVRFLFIVLSTTVSSSEKPPLTFPSLPSPSTLPPPTLFCFHCHMYHYLAETLAFCTPLPLEYKRASILEARTHEYPPSTVPRTYETPSNY